MTAATVAPTAARTSLTISRARQALATMDGTMGEVEDERMDDYRRHLYDALHQASRDYDQAILTLAAGTLALSVTFLHDITPTPIASTRVLVVGAWGSLGFALIAILVSFVTSQWGLRRRIAALGLRDERPPRWAELLTATLNLIAGLALIAGLVLLGLYALDNI